jgi:probable HAF family extracellular repeat protein
MKPRLAGLLAGAGLCAASALCHAAPQYTIRSLTQEFPPNVSVFALDLNSLGHALVSTSQSGGGGLAYWVCLDDGCALVGNDRNMVIHGLNDLDELARSVYQGYDYAFLGSNPIGYGRGACDYCGFGLNSEAYDGNSAGEATGWAQFSGPPGRLAFKYTKATGLVSLGTLGGTSSTGRRINKHGNVVGDSTLTGDSGPHGFLYARGVMTDLGTLGGQKSSASGLNSHDTVVGCSLLADNVTQRAFRYEAGVMSALPALTAGSSCAYAINDHGVAVGHSDGMNGARAVLFHKDGRVKNLNRLLEPVSGHGWTLTAATGINQAGQIIGNGAYKGMSRAFIMTPMAP